MPFVLAISGSPSGASKTALVADFVVKQLSTHEIDARHLMLRQLPCEPLMRANSADGQIAEAMRMVERADGIVLLTPTFKASYSGLLKAFLDLLPQYALDQKAVLPLATGGTLAHVLALDYGLRPVLQSMGARHIVQSYFLLESNLAVADGGLSIDNRAETSLLTAIRNFRLALDHSARHQLVT